MENSTMANVRGGISCDVEIPKEEYDLYKYFTKEELDETAKELAYMEKHLDEYEGYHDVHQMFEDIISED